MSTNTGENATTTFARVKIIAVLRLNHLMGPLRLTDLVGLDVCLNIAEYSHGKLGSESFRPSDSLRRLVNEGKLDKNIGEGYKWHEQETGQRAYTTRSRFFIEPGR